MNTAKSHGLLLSFAAQQARSAGGEVSSCSGRLLLSPGGPGHIHNDCIGNGDITSQFHVLWLTLGCFDSYIDAALIRVTTMWCEIVVTPDAVQSTRFPSYSPIDGTHKLNQQHLWRNNIDTIRPLFEYAHHGRWCAVLWCCVVWGYFYSLHGLVVLCVYGFFLIMLQGGF